MCYLRVRLVFCVSLLNKNVVFKVGVHNYFYHIFISTYNIYIEFVDIKSSKHDLTLYTVNMEFETTASSFSKIVTNICFHHVYNVNTNRTT